MVISTFSHLNWPEQPDTLRRAMPLTAGANMPDSKPPVPAKKAKLQKATLGDIILSMILPTWGVIVGVIALIKGERKRAATMIALGGVIAAICVWLWLLDRARP
jgi:hypothetical protein